MDGSIKRIRLSGLQKVTPRHMALIVLRYSPMLQSYHFCCEF